MSPSGIHELLNLKVHQSFEQKAIRPESINLTNSARLEVKSAGSQLKSLLTL